MTPRANSAGNTKPMDASSGTSFDRWIASIRATVKTPVAEAAITSNGELRSPVRKKATTMPGRMAWEIASLTSASRRSTR